jgi:hypothetical protein
MVNLTTSWTTGPDKCTKLTVPLPPIKHNYILHSHILESVTSVKYLGITLQSSLKWNLHYDNIISNGNKSLGFLKRYLTVSNTDIESRAYQAFVRPKLEYSCSVWDPHTNEYKKKIEMVQRRAARGYTMKNYHNTHCHIAVPSDTLVPSDNRLRKHHSQSYQHIQTSKDT